MKQKGLLSYSPQPCQSIAWLEKKPGDTLLAIVGIGKW